MKKTKNLVENMIHGIFLILGLITVGFVLLITIYLIISGIPAILIIFFAFFCSVKRLVSFYPEY